MKCFVGVNCRSINFVPYLFGADLNLSTSSYVTLKDQILKLHFFLFMLMFMRVTEVVNLFEMKAMNK